MGAGEEREQGLSLSGFKSFEADVGAGDPGEMGTAASKPRPTSSPASHPSVAGIPGGRNGVSRDAKRYQARFVGTRVD